MKILRNAIIGLILLIISLFSSGCTNRAVAPQIPLKSVEVEDLVAKPQPKLMSPTPAPKKIPLGASKSQALNIMTDNNIRSLGIENKYNDLQQYVCTLFKDPVGPVCPTK